MCNISEIVSLGICPDETTSLSGLTLMQAPGISPRNLSNIAADFDVNGITMAMQKKALALTLFKNDFYGALTANKVIPSLPKTHYGVTYFKTATSKGTYTGDRGIILHKNGAWKGSIRSTFINTIELYPLASGDTTIKLIVGQNIYAYNVTVVANQVNSFDGDVLDGFPFEIPEYIENVKILVDQTTIPFASSVITCKKGCDGTQPNECGWAEGWDGTAKEKSEGYGVTATFYCVCDYDKIICDMATSFTGELIWLKWQIAIFEEQVMSNRFDNWVIYNHDEIRDKLLPQLRNDYTGKWNSMMQGLYGILKNYKDSCLLCKGIRWVQNV